MAGRLFSPGTPVSSTNTTEILLKVELNTIKHHQTNKQTNNIFQADKTKAAPQNKKRPVVILSYTTKATSDYTYIPQITLVH